MITLEPEINELFAYLDKSCIRLPEFGCYVALSQDKTTIFQCVMNKGGSPERDADDPSHLDWVEVTAPEREFVNKVNAIFGTNFDWERFPGR